MSEKIIEVAGLNKSYGDVQAVKGIDFYVESGKIFAFLGPNGAGKSTTIDIICTFLKPDAGTVIVDGHVLGREDDAIRNVIGVVFQDGLLDGLLTVEENLKSRGAFYGLRGAKLKEAVECAVELCNLGDVLKRPYGKLSGGQRRRCDIARALINTPKVLFLDEPTTGLDPQTRKNIWDTFMKLNRQHGTTIFLTTHYMQEAEEADYVIIIDDGRIAAKGTPAELRQKYARDRLRIRCGRENLERIAARIRDFGYACRCGADVVEVAIPDTLSALPVLERCKDAIEGFEVISGTMDDAFIAITGKELRE